MKLRIKEEYKEYSIGGGKMKKIKLTNLDPSLYEYYYKNGYSEFFEEIENKKKKDDKNNKGDDTIGLFDINGESDIN